MTIDAAKRREWLRALRLFKYGIKARAKLGVFDAIAQRVAEERKGRTRWDAPDWDDTRWIDLLHESIRDNAFPDELLRGFVRTAEVTFYSQTMQPTRAAMAKAIDQILRHSSTLLRHRFGVFVHDNPATVSIVAVHEDGSQEAGQAGQAGTPR